MPERSGCVGFWSGLIRRAMVVGMVVGMVAVFFLPETRGKPLPE